MGLTDTLAGFLHLVTITPAIISQEVISWEAVGRLFPLSSAILSPTTEKTTRFAEAANFFQVLEHLERVLWHSTKLPYAVWRAAKCECKYPEKEF